jgi:hypothetical protein
MAKGITQAGIERQNNGQAYVFSSLCIGWMTVITLGSSLGMGVSNYRREDITHGGMSFLSSFLCTPRILILLNMSMASASSIGLLFIEMALKPIQSGALTSKILLLFCNLTPGHP